MGFVRVELYEFMAYENSFRVSIIRYSIGDTFMRNINEILPETDWYKEHLNVLGSIQKTDHFQKIFENNVLVTERGYQAALDGNLIEMIEEIREVFPNFSTVRGS